MKFTENNFEWKACRSAFIKEKIVTEMMSRARTSRRRSSSIDWPGTDRRKLFAYMSGRSAEDRSADGIHSVWGRGRWKYGNGDESGGA